MECNEVTLYDIKDNSLINKIINEEDIECKYTIPLIFLFFNELFGKAKFIFDNNYLMFPSHYYNPYDNYKLCFFNNYNELFEFYISNDTEIVKYLKYALFPNNELLNIKLWTSKNLNELRYIIKRKFYIINLNAKKIWIIFLMEKKISILFMLLMKMMRNILVNNFMKSIMIIIFMDKIFIKIIFSNIKTNSNVYNI